MKNQLIFILIIFFFFSCNKITETTLILDSEPAEKFIDIIDYIEKTSSQKLILKERSKKEMITIFNRNKSDKTLNSKIENLLDLEAYIKLKQDAVAFIDTSEVKGEKAYKLAFFNLPSRTRMRGDITVSWIDFWENNKNIKAAKFIKQLNKQKENIKNKAIRLSNKFYPSNIIKIDTIQTFFCLDGYRSSFTSNNVIYMDLITITDLNIERFTNILSHELHHINYSNWLSKKIELSTDKQKAIFSLQRGFILEGIAQQINFNDYSQQVKNLYNNKELLIKLNEDFIESLIRINESKTPLDTYQEYNSNIWKKSFPLLEKYCTEEISDNTVQHRPTYKYYISYQLYKVIEKNGKNEEFEFVLEHPESLLEIYNNLKNDNNIIPKYSDQIVELWKNNLLE